MTEPLSDDQREEVIANLTRDIRAGRRMIVVYVVVEDGDDTEAVLASVAQYADASMLTQLLRYVIEKCEEHGVVKSTVLSPIGTFPGMPGSKVN